MKTEQCEKNVKQYFHLELLRVKQTQNAECSMPVTRTCESVGTVSRTVYR